MPLQCSPPRFSCVHTIRLLYTLSQGIDRIKMLEGTADSETCFSLISKGGSFSMISEKFVFFTAGSSNLKKIESRFYTR